MDDATPLSLLRYTLELLSPYLPYPVKTSLNLALAGFDRLPPVLANILPVLLTVFAAYTAATSLYGTLRYTVRTAWWILKWATVIGVVAWAFGGGSSSSSTSASQRGGSSGGILNTLYNGYQHYANANGPSGSSRGSANGGLDGLADLVQEAAAAGLGGGKGKHSRRGGDLSLGFLGNFIPQEYRGMADSLSSLLGAGTSSNDQQDDPFATTRPASSSSSSSSRRGTGGGQGSLNDLDDQDATAKLGSWLSSAWESFSGGPAPQGDRWSESRTRRKAGTQRNR